MKRLILAVTLILVAGAVALPSAAQSFDTEGLTILMASPGEGESFYAAPQGFLLSIPIAGQVVSYGEHLDPASVEVTLEFIDAAGQRERLTTGLDDSGFFHVWASIQPFDRPFVSDDPHEIEDCAVCHRDHADLVLPEEVMLVTVAAQADDGRTGQAVRSLRLERGNYRDLVVNVEGLPDDAAAQVSAATIIFEWRRRAFYAPVSGEQATLQVEGLTYADLTYEVRLNPLIVDGVHYSAEPQTVVVTGGDASPPAVTLRAHPSMASLSGQVREGVSGQGLTASVLLVDRLSGQAFSTVTEDNGRFAFEELPVAEYALLARAPGSFHLPRHLNLTDEIAVSTRVNLTPAGEGTLNGVVTLDGQPLPFAEVRVDGLPTAYADPVSGAFALDAVPVDDAARLTVTAAGCYGVALSGSGDLGEIALEVHDNTRVISRGGARLYLPAQTAYRDENGVVTLQNGVLWVRDAAGAASPPLIIQAGDYRLTGEDDASFAVEAPGGAPARLYVSAGRVQATPLDEGDPIYVMMGQTLVLVSGSIGAVDLIPGAGAVLRSEAAITVPFELAPTPAERFSQGAYQVLVAAAKGTMALAYAISYALPVLIVVGAVVLLLRRRNTASRNS